MPKPRTPRDLADARFSRDLDETADELVVGEGVALDVQPAGLVLRLAAALLDGLCVLVLFVLALFGVSRLWPRGLEPAWGAALGIVLLVVVLVLVPAAVETVTKGRSVGRFATGTRVVRLDGGAIGFRHAFTRSLVGLFELWMTFGSVALLVALFGSRPRRLGDLLAGTIVQHERLPKQRDPEVLLPPELTAWADVADVSALPQRLENRLGAFFRGAALMRPELREAAAQTLAAEVSAFAHPVPPVPPEVFLAGVVVLRR
ncbi:RDD family protein, partial [Curtobacterium flaccumfaciens]|nr:RDD family protein [Curtobacterium flaccumfaciens]